MTPLTEDCGILERVPTVAPLCSNGSFLYNILPGFH